MPETPSSLRIYLRLLAYLKPFIGLFLTSIAGYIIFSSTQPMMAGILKYFVDGLTSEAAQTRYDFPLIGIMELLYGIPLLLVMVITWQGIGSFLGNYYLAKVSLGLINHLRQELFAKLVGEVAYRILDQLGAVVHRYHFHALGQAGLQRL